MSDPKKKFADNVPGAYYVDESCIDCDACRTEAPESFKRNDEAGYSFVFKQPSNDDEKKKAQLALEACPVEAIGQDG